jgi:hypothetical protein
MSATTIFPSIDTLDNLDVSFLPLKIQNLFALRGQFVSIKSRRIAETRKTVADVVEKESIFTARVGVSYENIATIKELRASGVESKPRSWGTYVPGLFPYLIEHKNSYYFHFTSVNGNNNCVPKVRWLKNGVEISADEAKILCTAKEFPKNKEERECFDMNVNHIIAINGELI